VPHNEMRTQVEYVFSDGEVPGIIAAYWTKKIVSDIKFDINKKEVTSLESFLANSNNKLVSVVELTKEV
jgi:hypothetical protein